MSGKRKVKVGDTVFVPWGHNKSLPARVLEIWGDPASHIRVMLMDMDMDEDEDPFILLLPSSWLATAA